MPDLRTPERFWGMPEPFVEPVRESIPEDQQCVLCGRQRDLAQHCERCYIELEERGEI